MSFNIRKQHCHLHLRYPCKQPDRPPLRWQFLIAGVLVTALAGIPRFFAAPSSNCEGYRLRVCKSCLSRQKGKFDTFDALQKTSEAAAAAGWPAPFVEMGKCTGACEYGPVVQLVHGRIAQPVSDIAGMTGEEVEMQSFLFVESEQMADRAFGLSSRYLADLDAD
eukprot:TRINITY_DN67013_c0_g1_i1.p1 TRINITY_DN67013_c0_g1~~TRINITY_DN67013_c0_g1_i1.p1  ORF type:complete len:165 (+),score=22.56 TRINITY_DN67013_c0_g1_i1:90-584(+)